MKLMGNFPAWRKTLQGRRPGCVASAGLASIGKHKLFSVLPGSGLFGISKRADESFSVWRSGEASGA